MERKGATVRSAVYPVAQITASMSSRIVPSVNSIVRGPRKRFMPWREVMRPVLRRGMMVSLAPGRLRVMLGLGRIRQEGSNQPQIFFIR